MDVPNRPRVLPGIPVLRRAAGVLQIGVDPRHALVVEEVRAPLAAALLALSGQHTTAELGESLAEHADQADELLEVLRWLAGRGLLEEAAPPPHPRLTAEATGWALRTGRPAPQLAATRAQRCVVVHGDGGLAVAVAGLLASAGVGRVHVATHGQVGAEDTGPGYPDADVGRPRREVAREAVRRASASVRTGVATRAPDLVVLADALVPRPDLVHALVLEGTTHLAVRVREGLGVVGPLVVPGRSSCLRCADLRRADEDGAWPLIAAQLADRVQHADQATTSVTAGLAAAQALLALDHEELTRAQPATWDGTLEVDAWNGAVERVPAPAHPRCECRARR
ncbi:TOMM precursor leader peptide-binding protein [Saccharothrix coeruleofusca]|nr:TOMM precursor leader peptide-binding protein [Saccharothrix coeruleofusca]